MMKHISDSGLGSFIFHSNHWFYTIHKSTKHITKTIAGCSAPTRAYTSERVSYWWYIMSLSSTYLDNSLWGFFHENDACAPSLILWETPYFIRIILASSGSVESTISIVTIDTSIVSHSITCCVHLYTQLSDQYQHSYQLCLFTLLLLFSINHHRSQLI